MDSCDFGLDFGDMARTTLILVWIFYVSAGNSFVFGWDCFDSAWLLLILLWVFVFRHGFMLF